MPGGFFRSLVRSLSRDDEYVVYTQPQPYGHNTGYGQPNYGLSGGPPPNQHTFPRNEPCGPQPNLNSNGQSQHQGSGQFAQNSQQQGQNYGQHQNFQPNAQNLPYEGLRSRPAAELGAPPFYNSVPSGPLPITPTQQPALENVGTRGSPFCSGSDGRMRESYFSALAPEFDVCASCYDLHISQTCFADRFQKAINSSGFHVFKTCDLSLRAVRGVWIDACSKANTAQSVQDQNVWLNHFQKQNSHIIREFQSLIARRESLKGEAERLNAEGQSLMDAGNIQLQYEGALPGVSLTAGYGPSILYHPGNNSGAATMTRGLQIKQQVPVKLAQIEQIQAQIMAIAA